MLEKVASKVTRVTCPGNGGWGEGAAWRRGGQPLCASLSASVTVLITVVLYGAQERVCMVVAGGGGGVGVSQLKFI